MQRRDFLVALFGVASLKAEESPRNKIATAGNAFVTALNAWARAFNSVEPGVVDATENAAWEPLPDLWRRMERLRRDWIRGER